MGQADARRGRKRSVTRAAAAAVERLEVRQMLSTVTWAGGAGNWNDAAKWVGGAVPTYQDDAVVPAGSTVTVSDSESPNTVTSAAGSTIDVTAAGDLNGRAGGQIAGTLTVEGALETEGTAAAPLVVSGTTNVTGAITDGTVRNDGQLSITAFGTVGYYRQSIVNNGTMTIATAVDFNQGTVTNNAGHTIDLATDDTVSDLTLYNSGTLAKTGGTGTSTLTNNGGVRDYGGTIAARSGTLTIATGSYFQGTTFTAAAGAAVNLDDSVGTYTGDFDLSGTVTGSGAGHLNFVTGTTYPGNPDVGGNAANTAFAMNFPAGFADVEAGMQIRQTGGDQLVNAGTLQFTGDAQHAAVDVDNTGTIAVTGAGDLGFGAQTGFVNDTAGVVDFTTDAGAATVDDGNGGSYTVTNKGLIEKTGGTGTTAIGVPIDNAAGQFDVGTGTLSLASTSDFAFTFGGITAAPGTVFDIDAGTSRIYTSGTFSVTGGGTVDFDGGDWYGPNASDGQDTTSPATLDFAPGTFLVGGGDFADNAAADLVNTGAIDYAGVNDLSAIDNRGVVLVTDAGPLTSTLGFVNDVGGVLDFEADAALTDGYHAGIYNYGGTILKSGGTGTLDLSNNYVDNTGGKIECASGTINLASYGATLPAGQTLQADAGGTITTADNAITDVEGTVALLGAGSSIPAVAGLSAVGGTFQVLTGASFTTAGDLAGTGTLIVGGTMTVAGALSMSQSTTVGAAPPTLEFAVEAAPGSGAPDLTVDGATTLAGDLTAGYAGGFGANAGTAYAPVATFAAAATGAFADTTGVGPAFTASVTPAAVDLDATGAGGAAAGVATAAGTTPTPTPTANSPSDLAVISVTAPATFAPGAQATVTFTVADQGANPANGSWTDSVYLSADATLDPTDTLLGTVVHTGSVAAGGTYTGSLTATFPSIVGPYHVIVVADSGLALPDTSRADNTGVSAVTTAAVPTLTLGQPLTGTIAAGQTLVYALTVPGRTDVRLTAAYAGPLDGDLEVARGAVPAPGAAGSTVVPVSGTAATLAATLASPIAGVYYVALTGQPSDGTAGTAFTLTAASAAYAVYAASPSTVGAGPAQVTVTGSGFTATSVVDVVAGNGNVVATATNVARDANTLTPTFDLSAVAPGAYTVRVATGANVATAPGGLTVQAAAAGGVTFSFAVPSVVRPNRTYDLIVTYTNTGNVDAAAPAFSLTEPNLSFRLAGGNAGASIHTDSSFTDAELDLVAINQEGVAGVLPAGYVGQFTVQFRTLNDTGDFVFTPTLNRLAGQQVDLGSLVGTAPTGISAVSAQVLAAQLAGQSTLTSEAVTPYGSGTSAAGLYPQYRADDGLVVSSDALDAQLDTVASALSTGGWYDARYAALVSDAAQVADGFGAATLRQTQGPFGYGVGSRVLNYSLQMTSPQVAAGSGASAVTTATLLTPTTLEAFTSTDGRAFTAVLPTTTDTLAVAADGTARVTASDGSYYQFAANGRLAYFSTAGGLQTTFAYDAAGDLTSVTDPAGQATTYAYTNGVVTSSTDPFGNVTTYGYRVDTVQVPATGTYPATPTYTDQSVPLLSTVTTPAGTTTITYTPTATLDYLYQTDPALVPKVTVVAVYADAIRPDTEPPASASGVSLETFYTSDPADQFLVSSIRLPDGSGANYTYDGFGRLASTSLPDGSAPVTFAYDASGLLTTATGADGSTASTLAGPGGQPLRSTDGTGRTTAYAYDGLTGLLTGLVLPSGAATALGYSAAGQLTSDTAATGATVTTARNATGQPTTFTDPNGNAYTIDFDASSNPTGLTFPDASTEAYGYDQYGQLATETGRDGQTDAVTRQAQGLITGEAFSDGAGDTYTYDAHGNLLAATNATGTVTLTYTAANQIATITDAAGHTLTYAYDSADRVQSVSDATGVISAYTYDADGRVSTVTDGAGNSVAAYTYDALGRTSMVTYGNGTMTVYGYDADGRITSITHLSAAHAVVTSTAYTYSPDGLPVTATDQAGAVTTYAYDAAGQLTRVVLPGGRTITYAYDAAGNRTAVTDTAAAAATAYAANADDQYTSAGSATYMYDADGSMATMTNAQGRTTYTYNEFGQLAGSAGPAGTYAYTYDAVGQLVAYTLNGARTTLVRDIDGQVIAAYDAAGNLLQHYQYAGTLIAQTGGSAGARYLQTDLTGNVTAATNAAGATVDTLAYLPFGEKLSATGSDGLLFTWGGSLGILDAGDGFYQAGRRTYSPALGRFVQPDPTGFGGGDVNLYRYGGNSPTAESDPTGLDPFSVGPPDPYTPPLPRTPPPIKPITPGPNLPPEPPPPAGPAAGLGGAAEGLEGVEGAAVVAESGGLLATLEAVVAFFGGPVVVGAGLTAFAIIALSRPGHTEELPPPPPPNIPPDFTGPLQPPGTPDSHHPVMQIVSGDPNDIAGPAGYGTAGFIPLAGAAPLPYRVDFANETTATAPAQTVTVTEQLDANLDWTSFQLGAITFGTYTVDVPAGLQQYSTRVDATATAGVLVGITAAFDPATGSVTWAFTSLDPTTLEPTTSATAGFLPPDDAAGDGEGSVAYSVRPKAALATGATISAVASVVFDTNAAISTPTIVNTIDAAAPTATLTALAPTQARLTIPLAWSGGDDAGGSGVAGYDVYVSVDGGGFTPFLTGTTTTSAVYTPAPGHTYEFYVVATDNAGNRQATPAAAQATTAVPAVARTLAASKGKPARFTDAAGRPVTFTLSGPGTATLSFLSAGNADPVQVTLTGTTAATRVTVTTSGPSGTLTLGDISATGSLAAFTAPAADLVGSFAVAGTLGTLVLDNTVDGPTAVAVGGAGVATTFRFGTLHDLSLTSAAPVRSMTAAGWTDGAAGTDALTAPSVGSLTVAGGFDADVTLSGTGLALRTATVRGSITGGTWTLAAGGAAAVTVRGNDAGSLTAKSVGSLKVGGNLSAATIILTGGGARAVDLSTLAVTGTVAGSTISAAAGVGTVTVGGMADSTLYAGVTAGTTGLPSAASELTGAGSIRSFTAVGRSPFAASDVAAYAAASVTLRDVTTDDGGVLFGVAAHTFGSFALDQPRAKPVRYAGRAIRSTLANLGGDLRVTVD